MFLFTVPNSYAVEGAESTCLTPTLSVTMQAIRGTKSAPIPAGER